MSSYALRISKFVFFCFLKKLNLITFISLCLKLTVKTPEQGQWCRPGVFIVNFEHVSLKMFELIPGDAFLNWKTHHY